MTGQVNAVIAPSGATTATRFDAGGRPVTVFDAIAWADFEPDDDIDGDHHPSRYGYDQVGRILWESDPSNPDTDGPGGTDAYVPVAGLHLRRIRRAGGGDNVLDPGHKTACDVHETTGNPVSQPGVCEVTTHRYDAAGNQVSVTVADNGDTTFASTAADEATTTFSYGILGRLRASTDPTGVTTSIAMT